jgi:hypothetical protein
MPAASSKPFEVQFVVKAASREAAERIVNAAIREAFKPEKEVPMSESSGPGSPGVYAPHTPVDANRGTRIPAADQRDAKNEKPA